MEDLWISKLLYWVSENIKNSSTEICISSQIILKRGMKNRIQNRQVMKTKVKDSLMKHQVLLFLKTKLFSEEERQGMEKDV